jgi:hypothetical protein
MIAVTRDAAWTARLRALAARGGWPFGVYEVLPSAGAAPGGEHVVVVLDLALAGSAPARAVVVLRGLFPGGRVALACGERELGAAGVQAGLVSGADEVVSKEWTDARLASRLGALRDAALAAAVRVSADGDLKAELRSRRVYLRSRSRWTEVVLPSAEFALLWTLLAREGRAVDRGELLDVLCADARRDVEPETVSRRALSLRRALSAWKGKIETVRGAYRLESSRRRSIT